METDDRYTIPLYTVALAAAHLGMKPGTLQRWVRKDGLITTVPPVGREPRLPFVALAEAQVYLEFRKAGLRLQAITEGMAKVREKLGARMLSHGVLAHDGREILMNWANGGNPEWTRARDLQGGLPEIIEIGLRPITWDDGGVPQTVRLTAYEGVSVVADPRYSFGQPIVDDVGVRVDDVLALFRAGECIVDVADEMALDPGMVESIVRTRVLALAA
jgi:uncharacterized protein (DUF433 family)